MGGGIITNLQIPGKGTESEGGLGIAFTGPNVIASSIIIPPSVRTPEDVEPFIVKVSYMYSYIMINFIRFLNFIHLCHNFMIHDRFIIKTIILSIHDWFKLYL